MYSSTLLESQVFVLDLPIMLLKSSWLVLDFSSTLCDLTWTLLAFQVNLASRFSNLIYDYIKLHTGLWFLAPQTCKEILKFSCNSYQWQEMHFELYTFYHVKGIFIRSPWLMYICQIQGCLLGSIVCEDQKQNMIYVKEKLLLLGLRRCLWCLWGDGEGSKIW